MFKGNYRVFLLAVFFWAGVVCAGPETDCVRLSRRLFLGTTALAAAAAVLPRVAFAEPVKPGGPEATALEPAKPPEKKVRPPGYWTTFWQSSVFTAGKFGWGALANRLELGNKVVTSNPISSRFMIDHPGQIILSSPLLEETVFRGLPALALGNSWHVGVPSTLAFGYAHNAAGTNPIPVTQLVGGAWYWQLQKTRGFTHSVLGHATNNAWAWVLMKAQD